MSTYLVIEWSVPEADAPQAEQAMAGVRAHVLAEHPEILSARLTRQFAGPLTHVGYRWEEKYADLTAIDELAGTPDCAAVWVPVNALAVAGSHRQSIWTDTGTPDA